MQKTQMKQSQRITCPSKSICFLAWYLLFFPQNTLHYFPQSDPADYSLNPYTLEEFSLCPQSQYVQIVYSINFLNILHLHACLLITYIVFLSSTKCCSWI